jgi:hypothetical protein
LRGSPNVEQIKQRGFQQIVEVTSVEQMSKMFALRRFDVIYGGDAINSYFNRNTRVTTPKASCRFSDLDVCVFFVFIQYKLPWIHCSSSPKTCL